MKKLYLNSHETFPLNRFLERALALNQKYHGARSLKVAVSFHLVARTQSCMGDFRYTQLRGSGMFIPDPDFFSFWISDPITTMKRSGDRKFVVLTFS